MKEKNQYKVLVVDDIPQNIQVVGNILGDKGIKMGFAMDGEQALQIIEKQELDLILLDISMPKINGYEVCNQVKKNPKKKHIPIIFLTAKVQDEDMIKGFELGAVDYITKPFNPAILISRVFTHLELKNSRDKMAGYIKIIDNRNKELKALNNTKDKLFSIISHDLRGPVGNIKSVLEMLNKKENLKGEDKALLELATKASFSAYVLVENLLSWAQVQTGQLAFYPRNANINALITVITELLQLTAKNKNINITFEPKEPLIAYIDEQMFNTVIRNLISNAIKFTEENGRIEIKTKYINNDLIEIAVIDNGIGISEEDISKIFSPEEHFSNYGTKKEKGTGLGLELCQGFINKNGGELSIESEVGKGSTFSFTVPVEKK